MKPGLSRTTRTTEDTNGCEFRYERYTASAGDLGGDDSRMYVDDVFGLGATTLAELKRLVAAK